MLADPLVTPRRSPSRMSKSDDLSARRFGLSLCLFLALLAGLTLPSFAQAADRPVPRGEAAMRAYAANLVLKSSRDWEERMQEGLPDFRLIYTPNRTYPPILGANREIEFDTNDVEDAVVALHDVETGEPLFACTVPCSAQVDSSKTYIAMFTKFGYVPAKSVLDRTHPEGEVFDEYLGSNLIEHAARAGQCWEAHKSAGFPDVENPQACARLPASMPGEATRSGHCRLQFNVLETGWIDNARVLSCTEPHFAEPSLAALSWWYYTPQTQRGQTMTQTGLSTTMRFRLVDETGRLIDEDGRTVR